MITRNDNTMLPIILLGKNKKPSEEVRHNQKAHSKKSGLFDIACGDASLLPEKDAAVNHSFSSDLGMAAALQAFSVFHLHFCYVSSPNVESENSSIR